MTKNRSRTLSVIPKMKKNRKAKVNPESKFQIDPEEITWACPDPAGWEYTEIWHQLQKSKKELDAILANLQNLECVTFENDKQLRTSIRAVQSRLEFVADILSD